MPQSPLAPEEPAPFLKKSRKSLTPGGERRPASTTGAPPGDVLDGMGTLLASCDLRRRNLTSRSVRSR